MLGLSETAILMLIVTVMVLFGHDKIPKFARSLGKARDEFKEGINDSGKGEEGTE